MMTATNIEWTQHTWNPTTGCFKISAGCSNCYAADMAKRLRGMNTPGYENGFALTLHPNRLIQPLQRKKPTVYFVNSMSDLFHKGIPDDYINKVLSVIEQTPQHTYQILTKRAFRLSTFFKNKPCPTNAWLGVTVEDKASLKRIGYLKQINSKIRFISMEPLLEDVGKINLHGIHWVIVGGESGVKARPMRPQWVESVRSQCEQYNIAFFFKQWGGWGADGKKRAKKINGREFHGKIWNQLPDFKKEEIYT